MASVVQGLSAQAGHDPPDLLAGADVDARIDRRFLDEAGEELDAFEGGEVVELEIRGEAESTVTQPIVGFYVQDRLGQTLFADNTAIGGLEDPPVLAAGGGFRAHFRFQLPWLPAGDYAVGVAIAEGTVEENVPLHWMESAVSFRIHGSHVGVGLVGLPLLSVSLEAIEPRALPTPQKPERQ